MAYLHEESDAHPGPDVKPVRKEPPTLLVNSRSSLCMTILITELLCIMLYTCKYICYKCNILNYIYYTYHKCSFITDLYIYRVVDEGKP